MLSNHRLSVLFPIGLGIVAFAGAVACSSKEDPAGPPSGAALVIPASGGTKADLGVVAWHVTSADASGIVLVGVDEKGGRRAELALHAEPRGPRASVFTADIKLPEPFTVRLETDGEGTTATGDDVATVPNVRKLIAHVMGDVEAFDATPRAPTELAKSSITPQSSGSSGLVSRENPVFNGPICLLDPKGAPCAGLVLQTVGAGGAALLACAGWALTGGKIAGGTCGFSALQAGGGLVQMAETKCGARFCSEMKK